MLVENRRLLLPLVYLVSLLGYFIKNFEVRKLESLGYHTALVGYVFSYFDATPVCAEQTGIQTDTIAYTAQA